LNQEDVKDTLDMTCAMEVNEDAFLQHGLAKVQMPIKSYLYFHEYNGDLRTMPAYIEDKDICGVKIVNSHPNNPKVGLPTVMGVVVLNSTNTGETLAIVEASYLTDIRTGAAGGIAAKYLARKDSEVVGIIGAGHQAHAQLLALSELFDIKEVKVTSLHMEECKEFECRLESEIDCEFTKTMNLEQICDCDILVTTTPSRNYLVEKEWVKPGTHINAIGADAKGKQEIDPSLLVHSKLVVDDIPQASHSGDINVPISEGKLEVEDIYCELGQIINGTYAGRQTDEEITIFDSTGLAIQDVATASYVYSKAKDKMIGKRVEMFF